MRDDMLHVSWSPTQEDNEADEKAYREAGPTDDLYDGELWNKVDELVESAKWDDDTKHEYMLALPDDLTNGQMLDCIEYLNQYQPWALGVPYKDIVNPSQKEIAKFIKTICNL